MGRSARLANLIAVLCSGVAMAQDPQTPAARLQRAIGAARQSGRLERLAGEQYLLSAMAADRYRITVRDDEVIVEHESTDLVRGRGWTWHEAVVLNGIGAVTSMSAAHCRAAVIGIVQGERLHLATSNITPPPSDPRTEDDDHWDESLLPALVTDYLWPLLEEEGTLTCLRLVLSPVRTDPQGGNSRSRFSWADQVRVSLQVEGHKVVATVARYGLTTVMERNKEGRLLGFKESFDTQSVHEGTEWNVVTQAQYEAAVAAAEPGWRDR